jgi:hypothetical protein
MAGDETGTPLASRGAGRRLAFRARAAVAWRLSCACWRAGGDCDSGLPSAFPYPQVTAAHGCVYVDRQIYPAQNLAGWHCVDRGGVVHDGFEQVADDGSRHHRGQLGRCCGISYRMPDTIQAIVEELDTARYRGDYPRIAQLKAALAWMPAPGPY